MDLSIILYQFTNVNLKVLLSTVFFEYVKV